MGRVRWHGVEGRLSWEAVRLSPSVCAVRRAPPPPPSAGRGSRVVVRLPAGQGPWLCASTWARVPPCVGLRGPNATHPVPARCRARGTIVFITRWRQPPWLKRSCSRACTARVPWCTRTASSCLRFPDFFCSPHSRGSPPPVALPCVARGPEARAQLARVCGWPRRRCARGAVSAQWAGFWLAPCRARGVGLWGAARRAAWSPCCLLLCVRRYGARGAARRAAWSPCCQSSAVAPRGCVSGGVAAVAGSPAVGLAAAFSGHLGR